MSVYLPGYYSYLKDEETHPDIITWGKHNLFPICDHILYDASTHLDNIHVFFIRNGIESLRERVLHILKERNPDILHHLKNSLFLRQYDPLLRY